MKPRFQWKHQGPSGNRPPSFWRLTMHNDVEWWDIVYPAWSYDDQGLDPIGSIFVDGYIVSLNILDANLDDPTVDLVSIARSIIDDLKTYLDGIVPQAVS